MDANPFFLSRKYLDAEADDYYALMGDDDMTLDDTVGAKYLDDAGYHRDITLDSPRV